MDEFLFWCRYPLVRLLLNEMTSLHSPSFQGNDFSTCKTYSELIAVISQSEVMSVGVGWST